MERFNKGSSAPKKSVVSIFSMCNLKSLDVFFNLGGVAKYIFKFLFVELGKIDNVYRRRNDFFF